MGVSPPGHGYLPVHCSALRLIQAQRAAHCSACVQHLGFTWNCGMLFYNSDPRLHCTLYL